MQKSGGNIFSNLLRSPRLPDPTNRLPQISPSLLEPPRKQSRSEGEHIDVIMGDEFKQNDLPTGAVANGMPVDEPLTVSVAETVFVETGGFTMVQLNQLERVNKVCNQQFMQLVASELRLRDDKIDQLQSRVADLEARFSDLESKSPEWSQAGKTSTSSSSVKPTLKQVVDSGKSREEALLALSKAADLVVLTDSNWREIQLSDFGKRTGNFAFKTKCSTLSDVPLVVPDIVGKVTLDKLKGALLSCSANTLENIGSLPISKEEKCKMYQSQVTDALKATKAGLPVPIFFETPQPIFAPGLPRRPKDGCDFLDGFVVDYGDAIPITVDYDMLTDSRGQFSDTASFYIDGKHIGHRCIDLKVNTLTKAIVHKIGYGDGSTIKTIRPVFDELRRLRDFHTAQRPPAQFHQTQNSRLYSQVHTKGPHNQNQVPQYPQNVGIDLSGPLNQLASAAFAIQESLANYPTPNWGGGYAKP